MIVIQYDLCIQYEFYLYASMSLLLNAKKYKVWRMYEGMHFPRRLTLIHRLLNWCMNADPILSATADHHTVQLSNPGTRV